MKHLKSGLQIAQNMKVIQNIVQKQMQIIIRMNVEIGEPTVTLKMRQYVKNTVNVHLKMVNVVSNYFFVLI